MRSWAPWFAERARKPRTFKPDDFDWEPVLAGIDKGLGWGPCKIELPEPYHRSRDAVRYMLGEGY